MKSALYLFSAGLLVAQAKLRPENGQDDQFSIWGSIGNAFKSAADTVASGVTSAADTVASGTTSAADTVASGVTSAADTVASGTTSAANTVASGVTSAADTVGNGVAAVATKAYTASASVVNQVADDFENGANFIAARANWAAVELSNPQTYINAMISTAQALSTYFNDLNALTGGQLTPENLEMADAVLDMVFPEGAVVFDGVTIVLELAMGSADITNNINGIINGVETKNYMEIIQNGFELFETINDLSGEGDDDGDAEDF